MSGSQEPKGAPSDQKGGAGGHRWVRLRPSRRPPNESRPELTLAVLLGPGEHEYVESFASQFREWPGDIVVIDDSSGDGSSDHLVRALRAAIESGNRVRVDRFRLGSDFGAGRNRAHELAAGRWILHADLDERWDPAGLAALPELVDQLERAGITVCGFARANYLDGVLVNDVPSSEWSEDALRRVAAAGGQWPPANLDVQYRLVRKSARWVGGIHEYPVPAGGSRSEVGVASSWIVHEKSLARQRRQDLLYGSLGHAVTMPEPRAGGPTKPGRAE